MNQTSKAQNTLKVVSILGTQKKGCTRYFSQFLLDSLAKKQAITVQEFVLPKDGPTFCTGCMACYSHGLNSCPHREQVQPLWQAICDADLVLLAQPTYVFGAPAQVKAFFDHLGLKWLAHSPEPKMLDKRVVILTQAAGGGTRKATGTVKTSFRFLGASSITSCTFAVRNGVLENIPPKTKAAIERKLDRLAERLTRQGKPSSPSLFTRVMFHAMRQGHSFISKNERRHGRSDTYDYLYWKQQGWLDKQWPWKKPEVAG